MQAGPADAYVGSKTAGRILGGGQCARAYKVALLGLVKTRQEPDGSILFSVADLVKLRDSDGKAGGTA